MNDRENRVERKRKISGTNSFFSRLNDHVMKRFLSRVWIFVLTFCFGISVSALWRIYTLPQLPEAVEVTEPAAIVVFPEDRTFAAVLHACGPTANHHVYQSSYGEQIGVSCENFRSPSAAARALKSNIGNAKVVERAFTVDSENVSGETVVVVGERAMELRITGKNLCITSAPSLSALRNFQRR